MPEVFEPGDTMHLRATFKKDGVPTDPTTIALSIMTPAGAVTTYTHAAAQITKDATGIYSKDVAVPTEGTWRWRWVGTGTVGAASEGKVRVRTSMFV
jgi:uncharacterized protein YfaS (alpha-2-macroglobulin family)